MTRAASDSFEHHDIVTCLGRLHVRCQGRGEAILFWSSLLMSSDMWLAQAAHFGEHYRVVLIDPPGHGDSEPLCRAFSFGECARCVAQVLDELGIERGHFVGNSWGGMIGGTFAARYPHRIGAAVLMNCTASPAGLRHRIEFPLMARIVRWQGGFKGPMIRSAVRAFTGPTSDRERPQVGESIRRALRRCRIDSVAWAVRSVVPQRPDQLELMQSIRTPVLVVAGEEDRTFPVSETLRMAAAIPASESVVMAGTAHLAALECPEPVNRLIEDFLARHPFASGGG
ncbi:alpha/beta fold hydrolase [Pseudomonas sp. PDNC002]|uniref:alpha/beta fold hydrolase n=1 Tax=Pseudomonas sp. PDNC002 TaxID=2811422 RepID=UPI0019668CDA|nr:alpha/beta hydrolase [Pseudomonas sp. PDNC002]QRY78015.1 alpha/beta fold hydrolase [Pseudomonas sp. PDNC002]